MKNIPSELGYTSFARVPSCFSRVQLFVSPWTIAHQAPLSVGFSREEFWSELPCPPPGDLPDPEIKPTSLGSPALAGRFSFSPGRLFTTDPPEKPIRSNNHQLLVAPYPLSGTPSSVGNRLPYSSRCCSDVTSSLRPAPTHSKLLTSPSCNACLLSLPYFLHLL